jgi:glycosyltransferase involved in cell wall biosynthesis
LDQPWAADFFERPSGTLVAISQNQASAHPDVPWQVIHNGLSLDGAPFGSERSDALCFVGRVAPEKGIVDAIEIARLAGRPLRIAAKIGTTSSEVAYNESVFQPALAAAGSDVEFLGELEQADRDGLFAESYASLMPGDWPEPFGLVAIESLACGTPIIARPTGALPEIIRDGVDGFFGEDVAEMAAKVELIAGLDRRAIRDDVLERFSAVRMADAYEALYREILAGRDARSARQAGNHSARSESVGARG